MNSSSEGQQITECCRNYEACRKSAITKSEDCEHRYSLKVIDEFQEVYRKRMKQLNEASDKSPELSELKIRTLQDWVEDLTEQNSLLATTLEELEAEAIAKANSLSRTSSDLSRPLNGTSFSDRKLELRDSDLSQKYLGNSLNELQQLKMENEELKQKYSKKEAGFEKYRMCVEKLLERVDQPLYDGSHSLNIFSSGDNPKVTHSQIFEFEHLNSMLEDYKSQIKLLKEELNRKESDLIKLKLLLEEKDEILAKNSEDLACLQEVAQEVDLLKTEIEKNRKNFHETRMSLAMEVASKHDQNLKLKHEIQLFEEQIRQSEMSTHFKDDIIKELRKELKAARSKEKNDDCLSQLQSKIDLLSMQLKTKSDLISQLEMKLRLGKTASNPHKATDDDKVEELKQKLREKETRINELEEKCSKVFSSNVGVENTSTSKYESIPNSTKDVVGEISPSVFFEKFEEYYKLSEEESIIFVNLFKENENATKLSQERESQVLALDGQLVTMSRLLNEILVLFEKIDGGNLLEDVDSEDSSQNEVCNQDVHNSVKLIQQNLNSVLTCLNGKDFGETDNCNNLLLNIENVFKQVQSDLFLLKEGYSTHKNQTEFVYEAYRKIQKSLKSFIEHIAEVTQCFEELKNLDFNEKLSNHQNKIHSLKQELQETRRRKEETLKIVEQYLTKEDTSNLAGRNSILENVRKFMILANESYDGLQNVLQDIDLILRVQPSNKEDVPASSEKDDVPHIKENILSTLEQLQSTNKKMKSVLENTTLSYTPVPPPKSCSNSRKEHEESESDPVKMITKQDQATNTESESKDAEQHLSELSIELEHTQSLLRNTEQDMNSRLQDFENYKNCAEKLIDDLKSQVTNLKKTQDNSAVTKLESKICTLEKEKEVFIKTIECQNKELMRIKQQFTGAQEEKNAALIEKSIAEDELKEKTSFVYEKLNAKDLRIKELSSMLDQTQQCVTKLQKDIETLHSNSGFVMEKLRKDLCEITVSLKERDTLLNKREECIDALHESIRLLEVENKDLRKEINNLVKQKEKYIEFEEKLLDAQDKIMLLETEKVSTHHRAVSTSDVSSNKSNRKFWSWTRFIKPSHSRNV